MDLNVCLNCGGLTHEDELYCSHECRLLDNATTELWVNPTKDLLSSNPILAYLFSHYFQLFHQRSSVCSYTRSPIPTSSISSEIRNYSFNKP
ncbi:extender-the chronological lifespan protein Ecl3 [Schizosaccharomyces cryophilus OY26]|uniref:Extender-the chronological lifespan protein Ecl3 n=1 Tax=Schizosaccharomyces cryophilus (strain OY26 / ATCC MYA-4695 / CBS 11777 / NBRC 106824 / NRRL Y48691) TaxID=653667 RepID=S9X5L7_SCHCR|nr:extender-the chronological lifespan protein Ecl3, variant [Schizosaccharomyces cryophilus OY26]XP_013022207.1 extender-the chronological lifespan protein Ecl3 [Schizosaccharomyces cryophilus OY26]EPY52321.1 extender-the chronological lifespan protein Ecl3, variant [Schizosaccharomyces cryophilus OY26]EPY52322.1 extender-the chronological lifespan protein Ecl3 [Schizosaccharomyces cryophilus OY26]